MICWMRRMGQCCCMDFRSCIIKEFNYRGIQADVLILGDWNKDSIYSWRMLVERTKQKYSE